MNSVLMILSSYVLFENLNEGGERVGGGGLNFPLISYKHKFIVLHKINMHTGPDLLRGFLSGFF